MIIYVDSLAAVGGDGSKNSPFKSVSEAQMKMREMKKANALPEGGISVSVASGEYILPQGLLFTEEDSGTESCPITYFSEEKHGALLSGGLKLDFKDFEPLSAEEKSRLYDKSASDKVLKVDLKKYGITSADIGKLYSNGSHVTVSCYDDAEGDGECELFFNGARMTLARYPNDDYLYIEKILDEGEKCNVRNPRGGTFTFGDDVKSHVSSWKDDGDLWTFGYFKYDWEDSTIRIKSLDSENKTVTLEHNCMFGMKDRARYYFFNIFEEIDSEGEYYIDRQNCVLYFYPPIGFESAEIVMTVSTKSVISVEGASYLTFKDFAIAYTRNDGIKINGGYDIYGSWGSRMRPRIKTEIDGHDITIDGCKIYAVRESAVYAHGQNITVKNCEVFNIGTNGIYISGGNRKTLEKSGNLIYNNLIHDWSQYVFTYCGAIGFQGCGTVISHNELYNCTHFAIFYLGNDHVVEYNNIHDVCLDTDDCAAIYSGRSYADRGTVLRYNYIHDVGKEPGEDRVGVNAEGIYFDDNMSGQTVYGNILANITGKAFHFGGGRELVCKNNLIYNCDICIWHDVRGFDGTFNNGWYGQFLKHESSWELIRLNLVPYKDETWSKAYPLLSKIKLDADTVSQDDPDLVVNPSYSVIKTNVVYRGKRSSREEINDRVRKFSEVEEPVFLENIEEDFPNHAEFDFTMSKNSKIKKVLPEFEEIPFDKIGRIK